MKEGVVVAWSEADTQEGSGAETEREIKSCVLYFNSQIKPDLCLGVSVMSQ